MAYLLNVRPAQVAQLLWVPSLLYLFVAVTGRLMQALKLSLQTIWNLACITSAVLFLFALACCTVALFQVNSLVVGPGLFMMGSGLCRLSFRFDAVGSLMLLLVTFLGWVIVNYSRAYLARDPRESHYVCNLMQTLAAVSLLVTTNNLILFLIAWILTSLSLHTLLTLYPDRQTALIAAHKKFLASRLGDISLLGAILILAAKTGSLEIDEVLRRVAAFHSSPRLLPVAATLLVFSALIKCAQLPLHGWLIQVMEAPTPVSALLHAGVVNLGGFMLIRLAPVINTAPVAQCLLVVAGCLTAVIASLVMTTRISIKVYLAWSTCAQMGFMLMECGLGLYHLAFLHLLAHSLYKAHTFLSSGGTVAHAKQARISCPRQTSGITESIATACLGVLLAALGALVWRPHHHIEPIDLFCIVVVGLATAGILAAAWLTRSIIGSLTFAASALGISLLYFGYDSLFEHLVPGLMIDLSQHLGALIFSVFCFVLLYIVQTIVRSRPTGQFATAVYPWLYAGLYLDELFTRATFCIWPARISPRGNDRRDVLHMFEKERVPL